jgi:hypothetical protein
MRRDPEAMQRTAERRDRENLADRLLLRIPNLKSLSIHIAERATDRSGMEVVYTRYIMVDRAPALFDIPCCEKNCRGGGHDLTSEVMAALRNGKTSFEGTDRCAGSVRDVSCPFELHFVAEAAYTAD